MTNERPKIVQRGERGSSGGSQGRRSIATAVGVVAVGVVAKVVPIDVIMDTKGA